MTTVWFFLDGHGIQKQAGDQWATVPRIGETIVFEDPHPSPYRVKDVVWQQSLKETGGAVARVHLEAIPNPR